MVMLGQVEAACIVLLLGLIMLYNIDAWSVMYSEATDYEYGSFARFTEQ